MATSIDDFDAIERLSSLPGRPLQEDDLEELNQHRDAEFFQASILPFDDGAITSVFIERGETLVVVGYSPRESAWFKYCELEGVEKTDEAVYEYVDLWDELVAREITAL